MSDENKIEEWIPDVEEYNLDNKYKFKCLLEYFVTHLEYIINEDANFVGYEKYLKSLVETNVFKKTGQGHKGHNIQKQIERWNNYSGNVICINIYASNPQSKATYLNWKSSWYNVRAEFKNEHVDSLYITEEEHKDAKSELKYSVDKLGLFSGLSTNEFNEFFDKYMSYMNVNQTTNNNNKYQEYIDILEANKNLILNGAPGTGKTWLAKEIAKEMGCSDNEIGFVQFHPSYDYTDFVEGLRPVEKDGNVGFERKDGVFKEFCKKSIETKRSNQIDNFEECWNKLVEKLNDDDFLDIRLLSGKKSFRIELNEYGTGLANRYYENDMYEKGEWIQGKSKFFSKEQLYNVYKGLPGVPAKGHDNYRKAIVNYMKENLDLKDYFAGADNIVTSKPFVFIIDEINRGEISKIFGELFYCIDPGYRGPQGRVLTQYQNLVPEGDVFENGFYVPENVYIIGTMNDIDRSVESMDFAFRRRFAFVEIKAEDRLSMLDELNDESLKEKAINRLKNLNNAISGIEGLSSAYHIGASYFLKLNNYGGNFEDLWNYHLDGLLKEYLRGMRDVEEKIKDLKKAYDNEFASNN
ncbi:MAG: AAA family ATPase [Bacteroidales bacterium]|nr:AAA family ATPase [Bacteroidales bacterium]